MVDHNFYMRVQDSPSKIILSNLCKTKGYANFPLGHIFWIAIRVKTIFKELVEAGGINIENEEYVKKIPILKVTEQIKLETGSKYSAQIYNDLGKLVQIDIFEGIKGIVWKDIRLSKEGLKIILDQFTKYPQRKGGVPMYIHPGTKEMNTLKFIDQVVNLARGIFTGSSRQYLWQMCFFDGLMFKPDNCYHFEYMQAFMVVPVRLPLIDLKNRKLVGFKFTQHLEIFPYKRKFESKVRDQMITALQTRFKGDHDRFECFNPNYILTHIPIDKRRTLAYKDIQSIVTQKIDHVNDEYNYLPKHFENQLLKEDFANNYKFNGQKWLYNEEFEKIEDKFKVADEALVDTVQDEKGAEQLLKLIQAIPKLRFNLTPEQQRMISTPSNLLCLGRSGTGKTTSSALRLFSTDAFYKYMEQLRDFKQKNPGKFNQHFRVEPTFMNAPSKLKLVFVTASPVLTNEVKKFYTEMKEHVINELIARRERQLARQQKQQEGDKNEFSIIEDDASMQNDTSTNQGDDKAEQEMQDYLQFEKQLLEDDEQLEKQLQLPSSMDYLNYDHYPLFVTVKRLIWMLDASLPYSFFSRNYEGGLIGMENNVQWHNESRGVYMINQYYKQQRNYDEKIKKLGKKLMEFEEKIEIEEANEILQSMDEAGFQGQQREQNQFENYNVSAALSHFISQGSEDTYNIQGRQLSFEVDFETFRTRFWHRVNGWTKLSPLVVWTEIYSIIKGHADSYKYDDSVLPLGVYLGNLKGNVESASFLTIQEKIMIYQIFMHYEHWKQQMNAYDFMDVVNHIIRYTSRFGFKQSQQIHFLMVDEVQDLTPNLLWLLTTMTERNIFFCGDTAQTIAKGVGFRFYDLKKIFINNEHFKAPQVLQLTKNFRSHSKILDLANSVVSLIELFFPKTIDKLLKESSDFDGPKPIFIEPANGDQLMRLIFGRTFNNMTQIDISQVPVEGSAMNKPQFGCNQVIIVRDQESKLHIPDFLQNMLCLTVYEAKGLEFDDVILYNFFQDSKCGSQWMLMKDVDFELKKIKKYKDFDFLDFNSLDINEDQIYKIKGGVSQEEEKESIQTSVQNEDEEIITKLKLKRDRGEVYRQFAQLCTELKFLYVAITRPKKVLIIYDDDNKQRGPLQDFWKKTGLIEVVSKDMLNDHSLIPLEIANVFTKEMSAKFTTQDEWRWQGITLFKKKFYHSAIQCFRNSGDEALVDRCLAYQHADKATLLLGESDQKQLQSKNKAFKKSERNQYLRESKEMKREAFKELEQAGFLFEKIQMHRHAAQCYCTANKLEKAASMFESLVDFGQSAECYMKTGNLSKAADYYAKGGLFANAFECYERLQHWEGLLLCLSKHKDYFKKEERESLIEKYFPIALNHLYQIYANFDPMGPNIGMSEENKGKIQEMKIKMKFQNSISIIKEENDEEEENYYEEDDEDEEEEKQKEEEDQDEKINENQQQISVEKQKQESFELIDTSSKKEKPKFNKYRLGDDDDEEESKGDAQADDTNNLDNEFASLDELNLEKQVSIEVENAEPKEKNNEKGQDGSKFSASDFEILSSVDPDDEFLRSKKSVSIIESLISDQSESFSIISHQTSEFSIIQNSKLHSIVMSVYSLKSEQQDLQKDQTIDLASQIQELNESNVGFHLDNSSKFSTIEHERDVYAEDIVMQKIIFYVSLFSEDVKNRLKEMRSKASLEHLEKDPDYNNDFMLIDLDNISQELLYLILDVLEHYELFRLCLIICNRYDLKEKIGRYLVSIGYKYSNLKQFKFTFMRKYTKISEFEAQKKYSLIAHEAIHNVFQMMEKDFLKIDEQTGKDSLRLKDTCFDNLFIQGFWKKLIFLMDTDSSLELSSAVGDKNSFKLIYAVYKSGVKDPKLIKEILEGNSKPFKDLIHDDYNDHSKILANELLLYEDLQELKVNLFSAFNHKSPDYHSQKAMQAMNNYKYLIGKKLTDTFKGKNLDFGLAKRQISFLFGLLALQFNHQGEIGRFFYSSGLELEDYKLIHEVMIGILRMLTNDQKISGGYKQLLRIIDEIKRIAFRPLGVSMLDGLELFKSFSQDYCLVQKDSQIYKSIFSKQERELVLFENKQVHELAVQNSSQYQYHNMLYNFIQNQMTKIKKNVDNNVNANKELLAIACDLNLDFFLVPKEWINDIMISKVLNFCNFLVSMQNFRQSSIFLRTQYIGSLNLFISQIKKLGKNLLNRPQLETAIITRQKNINQQVTYLISQTSGYDQTPIVAKMTLDTVAKCIKEAKNQILTLNENILAGDQSIAFMPNDKVRQIKMSFDEKAVLLQLALYQGKLTFTQDFESKEKYYSSLLKTSKLFALADEYLYMIHLIRGKKKKLKKLTVKVNRESKIDQLSVAYSLLDAHVYIKCNCWTSAIDSIYSFMNKAFNFIPFNDILTLIEGCFYRALFAYYIFRTSEEKGVIMPDYAMKYIEPGSNYKSMPIDKKNQLYEVKVINYPQISIDYAKDNKLIVEGFYWAQLLVKVVSKDEECLMHKGTFDSIYNMIMTLFINTTEEELQKNQRLVGYIAEIGSLMLDSTLEKHFKHAEYFTEKSEVKNQPIYYKNMSEKKLFSVLKYEKGSAVPGFVRIRFTGSYNKETTKQLQQYMDKAYYKEQQILAKQICASNYICRVFRKYSALRKQKKTEQTQNLQTKETLEQQLIRQERFFKYGYIINQMKFSPKNKEEIENVKALLVNCMNNEETLIRSLLHYSNSKLIVNSLDLHYLIKKREQAMNKRLDFQDYVKKIIRDRNINIEKLKDIITEEENYVGQQMKELNEWLGMKAEPNLIELEKKELNQRMKWENFIQFQKRKKIILKHLSKKK